MKNKNRRLEEINSAAVDAFKKIVDEQENSFVNIFKAGVDYADSNPVEEWTVNEDLEKSALQYANKELVKAGVTDANTPRELAVAQASLMANGYKAGAQWQKIHIISIVKDCFDKYDELYTEHLRAGDSTGEVAWAEGSKDCAEWILKKINEE